MLDQYMANTLQCRHTQNSSGTRSPEATLVQQPPWTNTAFSVGPLNFCAQAPILFPILKLPRSGTTAITACRCLQCRHVTSQRDKHPGANKIPSRDPRLWVSMLNLFKGIALVIASIHNRVFIMNNGSLEPANYICRVVSLKNRCWTDGSQIISHATIYSKSKGCGEKCSVWNILLISMGPLYFFIGIQRLTEVCKLLVKNCRAADGWLQ